MQRARASGVVFLLAALDLGGRVVLAADSPTKTYQIEPQPVSTALKAFAAQSDMQLIFTEEDAGSAKSSGVMGAKSARDALQAILKGTGLKFEFTANNVVVVTKAVAAGVRPAAQDPSSAEPAEGKGGGSKEAARDVQLEEIIVTAQKREERLQDVPMSIVAISQATLEERRVASLDDLPGVVPGLAVMSDGSATRRIMLRGISNTSGNGSTALIGLYLDESSVTGGLSSQLDLRVHDLDRVEVLRGPQGTLYGDGSVGGTVRFITHDPALDQFHLTGDFTALYTQDGAPGQRLDEVVNIPLLADTLGIRIAGAFEHEGGWIDQPAANQRNINSSNLADIRMKGLWKPAADLSVHAMALIHRKDTGSNGGEDPSGNFTQVFNLTTTPNIRDDYKVYNITLDYSPGAFRVLDAATYVDQDQRVNNIGTYFQLTPPGTPPFELYENYRNQTKIFSNELRVSSVGEGSWQWTLGGFFRHLQGTLATPVAYVGFAQPADTPLPDPLPSSVADATSRSIAGFADTSFRVLRWLTLGAGVRYFHDKQTSTPPDQEGAFHATSPRAFAEIKLTDEINAYASAAKGFRSGGFNYAAIVPTFGPENVWTYEVGTKISSAPARLQFDSDIFYSDYKDYIVAGLNAVHPELGNYYQNAGDALIRGVEWDLAWKPLPGWTVSLGGDYLKTAFTRIAVAATSYERGDPLDLFPKYSLTVSAEREFRWQGRSGFVRIDYSQQGRETFRNRNVAGPTPWYFGGSDVVHTLNANVGLRWSENLRLGVFAQNLCNDRGLIAPYSPNGESDSEIRARPRTVGAYVSVSLD